MKDYTPNERKYTTSEKSGTPYVKNRVLVSEKYGTITILLYLNYT